MKSSGASSYHRFLQGDNRALEELITEYSDALVRYAFMYVKNSDVAEDIMEDTFATLIVKRKRFKEDSPFKAYLFKITRNKSIDFLRSKRRTDIPFSDLENVLQAESAEHSLLEKERDRHIYQCMQSLHPDYSEVLYLTYFEGFSTEDICKSTDRSVKQIYNLLARAKASLRELLVKEGWI